MIQNRLKALPGYSRYQRVADKSRNASISSHAGAKKKKLSVSKVTLKMDGKTVKTIKKPALTPDPGKKDKFTQIMVVNTWNSNANKKCAATSIKKMPKKSMTVTVTGKLK